jgi:Macrocin-O-methyltransferase (TylF)
MSRFDWAIHPSSRIERMPKLARPLALLVRNLLRKTEIDKLENYHHRFDGIATRHNDGFRNDPRFRKAYDRAVSASGWDYGVPYRVHQALWCSRQAQKVDGDFVELGTGRGFTMSAVLADFAAWNAGTRALHLFDTFEKTLPDDTGKQTTIGLASPFYATSIAEVKNNFSEWKRVYVHQGNVFDTLLKFDGTKVAFLHIDMNFHEPEVYGLRILWERIPRGGVVLLDDYAFQGHEQQYRAMNRLGSEVGFDILSTATGQGIIIK